MTQLQVLSIAGPVCAALLVGLVVWLSNRHDDIAMRREKDMAATTSPTVSENGSVEVAVSNYFAKSSGGEIAEAITLNSLEAYRAIYHLDLNQFVLKEPALDISAARLLDVDLVRPHGRRIPARHLRYVS